MKNIKHEIGNRSYCCCKKLVILIIVSNINFKISIYYSYFIYSINLGN